MKRVSLNHYFQLLLDLYQELNLSLFRHLSQQEKNLRLTSQTAVRHSRIDAEMGLTWPKEKEEFMLLEVGEPLAPLARAGIDETKEAQRILGFN